MKIVNSQHIFLPVTGGSLRPRILLGQGLVGRLAGSNTTTEAHRTSVITHGLGGQSFSGFVICGVKPFMTPEARDNMLSTRHLRFMFRSWGREA